MVIFEDSDRSSISSLLYEVYGNNVRFSNGNENLIRVIDASLSKGLDVVCFVDFVPDNPDTNKTYTELREYYFGNDNVHILRIPCIEFIVLKMLIELEIMQKTPEVDKFIRSIKGDKVAYTAKSYERFCKGILRQTKKKCLHNEEIKGSVSYWYRGSCECIGKFADSCKKFNITQKAAALAFFLPYFEEGRRLDYLVKLGKLSKNTIEEAEVLCNTWQEVIKRAVWK